MKATLLLADYAELSNGKLGVLGGGLTWFFAQSAVPLSVAVLLDADANEGGAKYDVRLRIVNLGGEPMGFIGDDGKPYRYEIDDIIEWPKKDANIENDLDFIWVGRFFGINLDEGIHRLEFVVKEEVVGSQVFAVRPKSAAGE